MDSVSSHYRVLTRCTTYGHVTPCVDSALGDRIVALQHAAGYDSIKVPHCTLVGACAEGTHITTRHLDTLTTMAMGMRLAAPRPGATTSAPYRGVFFSTLSLSVAMSAEQRAFAASMLAQHALATQRVVPR